MIRDLLSADNMHAAPRICYIAPPPSTPSSVGKRRWTDQGSNVLPGECPWGVWQRLHRHGCTFAVHKHVQTRRGGGMWRLTL